MTWAIGTEMFGNDNSWNLETVGGADERMHDDEMDIFLGIPPENQFGQEEIDRSIEAIGNDLLDPQFHESLKKLDDERMHDDLGINDGTDADETMHDGEMNRFLDILPENQLGQEEFDELVNNHLTDDDDNRAFEENNIFRWHKGGSCDGVKIERSFSEAGTLGEIVLPTLARFIAYRPKYKEYILAATEFRKKMIASAQI